MNSVYVITNTVNGKRYVGKTGKAIDVRFDEHVREAQRGSDRRLYQAMRKHGASSFSISLLQECQDAEASHVEKEWVARLRTKEYAHGYNMTDGGEGTPGALISEKTREKMRESSRERVASMSDEERRAMTAAANEKKRGSRERPSKKKEAQMKRWASMSPEERLAYGAKIAAGVSAEGRKRQVKGMNTAFSPVRQKGFKQPLAKCPHCLKEGGLFSLKRYHFERCKFK